MDCWNLFKSHGRTRPQPHPVWAGMVIALALGLAPNSTRALDFTTRQLANETKINRDASIGPNGWALWIQFITNGTSSAITDLMLYRNGERSSLGADRADTFFGNTKPLIQSNYVVWVANYRQFVGSSWELVEVPHPDEGAAEIPALYKAFENQAGDQWFVNLSDATNGVMIYTNRGVVVTNVLAEATGTNNLLRRHPSGGSEICLWTGSGEVTRVSTDLRNDFAPTVWGGLVAWQKAKGWPFGWEVMMWETGKTSQLTTNYYYDMAPVVQNRQVVWYGWDGYDFEIFLYDADKDETVQITSNRYDDVGPVLWDGVIAWEGYPAVESDVFMWKNGQINKLSDNVEDDTNPRIWNGQVVWQGFDGDDFEVYLFDGSKTVKLTANDFDDVNPEISDGLITWMGYEKNWDAEIFASDGKAIKQLTENEVEDRDPKTAGGRIVWTVEVDGKGQVWMAEQP